MFLIAYVTPQDVMMSTHMGSMPFEAVVQNRPRKAQYAITQVDKEYWLIDLYASKVTVNQEIVMGEYKVFTDSQAAITAARLLL